MSSRFGRCRNQDYCTLALQNTVLRLGEGELFVCPECARPLAAAPAWGKGGAGRAALLRLLPPLGIAAVGVAAIVFGVQYSETPPPAKPAPAPPPSLRMAAATPLAKPAPPLPRAKIAPPARAKIIPPAPPPEIVVLRVAAAPPLNTMLLPQLAAAYLAIGRNAQPLIATVGDAVHVAVQVDGRLLAVVIREAPAGNTRIAEDSDFVCAAGAVVPDALKPARLALAAMPAAPHEVINCTLGDNGPATEFALFLGTAEARQIVAGAGYLPPFRPLPRPAAGKAVVAAKAEPTPESADDGDAPPAPRVVQLPANSALTADALKAMTTPDQLDGATHNDSDAPPKPRTVILPASAQISFAPYQGVKLPVPKLHMYSVSATGTRPPGDVHADCEIGTDGIPTDCRQISHTGTQAEADAILAWLPSGGIRYTPKQKDGRPIAERRVLTVKFGGAKEARPGAPPLDPAKG